MGGGGGDTSRGWERGWVEQRLRNCMKKNWECVCEGGGGGRGDTSSWRKAGDVVGGWLLGVIDISRGREGGRLVLFVCVSGCLLASGRSVKQTNVDTGRWPARLGSIYFPCLNPMAGNLYQTFCSPTGAAAGRRYQQKIV